MGSYSGEDTVSVYCFARLIGKNYNGLLDHFADEVNDKIIEIFFDKNNQIEKFYLKFLEIDLKDKLSKEVSNYLISLYEKGEKEIDELEIEIGYDVRGYYDPGVTSGPPEHCYPPEGDEERDITSSTIVFSEKITLEIPAENYNKVYDVFEKEINENQFTSYDDGPEYEPDYDY